MEDSERIFTELIHRSELIRLIRDQEKTAVSGAEGRLERLERLEREINDLRRRDAELEQLSHTQDHVRFLQVTEAAFTLGINMRSPRSDQANQIISQSEHGAFTLANIS